MKLLDVYDVPMAPAILFNLLKERTPEQSISHKSMPSAAEHLEFFMSKPYSHWYIVEVDGDYVGSVYLTELREIGIFIKKRFQGNGYGKRIVKEIMDRHPGRILANINPANSVSCSMFEKLGAKMIQVTYELPAYAGTNSED